MTAHTPAIAFDPARTRPQARSAHPHPTTVGDTPGHAGAAVAALLLAVPAAIFSTALWFAVRGGGLGQLALVYTLSGTLSFGAVLGGLCLSRRIRG